MDLAEIVHTCSLGKYLGFFFIFRKFSFLGIGDEFLAKTRLRLWGQHEDFKNLFSNYTIGPSKHLKVTEFEPSFVRQFVITVK